MNIAYIHNSKKLHTGAHYINDLMAKKLRKKGIFVNEFYPKRALFESANNLKGLANILFFYSLLENKRKILRNDIIQGTTYTPLTFLAFQKPVISHFGSTTYGFLKNTPRAYQLHEDTKDIFYALRRARVLSALNIQTKRPLRDVAEIEQHVAQRADRVIATSNGVRDELMAQGVNKERITVLHNAIEDFWFANPIPTKALSPPHLVFVGRISNDAFTWKLKGVDRLISVYKKFPAIPKRSFFITINDRLDGWLHAHTKQHIGYYNLLKEEMLVHLQALYGSIFLLTSRYEGFSLSLIETMSQGIIPVAYPVGVVPEIIQNGENGFIVHTHKEMLDRIRELTSDTNKRAYIAHNAQRSAQQFRGDALAGALVTLYKEVLSAHRKTLKTGFQSGSGRQP